MNLLNSIRSKNMKKNIMSVDDITDYQIIENLVNEKIYKKLDHLVADVKRG